MSDGNEAEIFCLICKLCELCCLCTECCIECCRLCKEEDGANQTNIANTTVPYASVNSSTTARPVYITNPSQGQNFTNIMPMSQPSAPPEQPLLHPLGFGNSKVADAPPSYEEATRSNLMEATVKIAKQKILFSMCCGIIGDCLGGCCYVSVLYCWFYCRKLEECCKCNSSKQTAQVSTEKNEETEPSDVDTTILVGVTTSQPVRTQPPQEQDTQQT